MVRSCVVRGSSVQHAKYLMFLLGLRLEGGQHISPGRAVELGDVLANGAGVSCGALLGLPIRACIAIL